MPLPNTGSHDPLLEELLIDNDQFNFNQPQPSRAGLTAQNTTASSGSHGGDRVNRVAYITLYKL